MNRKATKHQSTEDLFKEYLDVILKSRDLAKQSPGNYKVLNKLVAIEVGLAEELFERGEEGIKLISSLLDHPRPDVRISIGNLLYKRFPERVRDVYIGLWNETGMVGFHARINANAWLREDPDIWKGVVVPDEFTSEDE